MRIFQGQDEGQGRERSYPSHLPQELRFRIMLCGYLLNFALILPDTLCQLPDGLQQGSESRHKLLGQILGHLLMKAPRRALGPAQAPKDFTTARTWLISCAREPTNASRERIIAYQEPGSPHPGA
jgi:hypothetical protein